MSRFVLSFKPAIGLCGQRDPAATLLKDGTLVFGIEEKRLTQERYAPQMFPDRDDTTRPQVVQKDRNPRYYRLLRDFEEITGTPVVLNASYNNHGEPIVNTPTEALKGFFSMGLDVLAIEADFARSRHRIVRGCFSE